MPVITMLEKLGFRSLVEQAVTLKRIPRAMDLYRFVLGIVLGLYIGFPRLNQLRFIARDPILTGVLPVTKLPAQSTFWRFVNTLHRNVARQILTIMRTMRERVWESANVKLEVVTIDTDTTVHTLYGQQMGGRKSYNPKNKGRKSYQPMLTFIAETRQYVWGELRNGDRPDHKRSLMQALSWIRLTMRLRQRSGKQIGDHLRNVRAALPPGVKQIYGRADSGFYCREAVEAIAEDGCGRGVRIPIPAGRLEQAVSVRGPAQTKTTRGAGNRGDGAVSAIRNQPIQIPGFRHRHEGSNLLRGLVLRPAGWSRKPDQRSEQRRRAGGASVRPF
jgi:hypothetical protein